MVIARSKLTAQAQISVPAEVRRKLGVGPGAVLEWSDSESGEHVLVRRVGRHTSEDIHRVLFPKRAPKLRTVEEMDAGISRHMRARHARR